MMLPKYPILYGLIFSFLVLLPSPSVSYILIIFLASILINVGYYFIYVKRKKDFSLERAKQNFLELEKQAKKYIRQEKKVKMPIVIFHTIEFLILIVILSLFGKLFFFVLIGLLFHYFLDIIDIYLNFKTLSIRDFSIIFCLANKNKKDIEYL